ncbi:MAG: hypothetical protein Q8L45_14705 [Xanthomonadaceae bacterium]|nr:hypothetical protein [Xanthomonadaceae bacterium]MDZ4377085.1 hypothetical protein [Xanthomonadaceae bacterium]
MRSVANKMQFDVAVGICKWRFLYHRIVGKSLNHAATTACVVCLQCNQPRIHHHAQLGGKLAESARVAD